MTTNSETFIHEIKYGSSTVKVTFNEGGLLEEFTVNGIVEITPSGDVFIKVSQEEGNDP